MGIFSVLLAHSKQSLLQSNAKLVRVAKLQHYGQFSRRQQEAYLFFGLFFGISSLLPQLGKFPLNFLGFDHVLTILLQLGDLLPLNFPGFDHVLMLLLQLGDLLQGETSKDCRGLGLGLSNTFDQST